MRPCSDFVARVLDPSPKNKFLPSFLPVAEEIARLGAINSLSQVALKLTAPGVPDIYQGNEIWDFSLVDPDNRRPVDYQQRRQMLDSLEQRYAGRVARKTGPMGGSNCSSPSGCSVFGAIIRACFEHGNYLPLSVERNAFADCCVAFRAGARRPMDRGPRSASFFARRISADRREVAGHGGGIAGVALARRRQGIVHRPRASVSDEWRSEISRSDGDPALRRL